jgi:hypothetical protein
MFRTESAEDSEAINIQCSFRDNWRKEKKHVSEFLLRLRVVCVLTVFFFFLHREVSRTLIQTEVRNVTITILDITHRPVFYLKLNSAQLYRFVRTSQETHYVSATSPTG